MKKNKIILLSALLIFCVLNNYCFAFSFEFNSNTYTIDYDIPEFPSNYIDEYNMSYNFFNYLLIYNCSSNTFDLLCFKTDNLITIKRMGEKLSVPVSYIFSISNNAWEYVRYTSRYDFSSTLGSQVILYKSDSVTIDSSVYDIAGDGSVTLDFILKDTEITENGYKYVVIDKPIEKEITLKDIYNSLNILVFVATILLIYLFLKSILRVRG